MAPQPVEIAKNGTGNGSGCSHRGKEISGKNTIVAAVPKPSWLRYRRSTRLA
jgi:hypothetical protein